MGKRKIRYSSYSDDSSDGSTDSDYEKLLVQNRKLLKKLRRKKEREAIDNGGRRKRRQHVGRRRQVQVSSSDVLSDVSSMDENFQQSEDTAGQNKIEYVEVSKENTLESEVLEALGAVEHENTRNEAEDLQEDLSKRWTLILKKGLPDETRQKLMEKYPVPKNCSLMIPPMLNPEVKSAVSESAVNRDIRFANNQKQMAAALSAIGKSITDIIVPKENEKGSNISLIETLSDAGRLIADLHFSESKSRQNLISLNLDKSLKDVLNTTTLDGYLFGNNLGENLKTVKAIEKTGEELKMSTKTNYKKNLNLKQPLKRLNRLSGKNTHRSRNYNQNHHQSRSFHQKSKKTHNSHLANKEEYRRRKQY